MYNKYSFDVVRKDVTLRGMLRHLLS